MNVFTLDYSICYHLVHVGYGKERENKVPLPDHSSGINKGCGSNSGVSDKGIRFINLNLLRQEAL